MSLRSNLQATATRLISKNGDTVQLTTYTTTAGATEFETPTITATTQVVDAVVTGVGKWEVSETILTTDLVVLVSGADTLAGVGDVIGIGGKDYTIIMRKDILAAGIKSAVKYYVRRG